MVDTYLERVWADRPRSGFLAALYRGVSSSGHWDSEKTPGVKKREEA